MYMLYYVVRCDAMRCDAMPCDAMPCHATPCEAHACRRRGVGKETSCSSSVRGIVLGHALHAYISGQRLDLQASFEAAAAEC